MRLPEAIDLAGHFWLPENPDERISGTMRIEESGKCTLELIGVFGDSLKFDDDPNLPTILGEVERGNVTLDNCFYTFRPFAVGRVAKARVHVNCVYLGGHAEANVSFSKIGFTVEGLDEWLGISGMRFDRTEEGLPSIRYVQPHTIACSLTERIDLNIEFRYSMSNVGSRDVAVKQSAALVLTSNDLISSSDAFECIHRLNNFFSFATDTPVSLTSITAYSPRVLTRDGTGEEVEAPLAVFYSSLPSSGKPTNPHSREMLFTYPAVSERLELVLQSWMANHEVLSPAFSLYFSSMSGIHKYLEGGFLSLAQAIETLHRRTSTQTLMTEESYSSLVATICKNCPDEHSKWLTARLSHGNELPLRTRLEQMIEPFGALIGTTRKQNAFIWKVVNTRNYLTHFDERLSKEAANGLRLYELTLKLEALFQLHLLTLIGFALSDIIAMANRHGELRSKLQYTAPRDED